MKLHLSIFQYKEYADEKQKKKKKVLKVTKTIIICY